MALKSIMLMVLAVGILVVPGMLYNNLNNNGLVVAQGQSLNCSSDAQTPTCQISGNVGCQASSAYCTLSGSSISFLSHTSIFTQLLAGNIFGVWAALTNGGQTKSYGPFDLVGGGSYVTANCWVQKQNSGALTNGYSFLSCTQNTPDQQNMTIANTDTVSNWNPNCPGCTSKSVHFFQWVSNATYFFQCAFQFQLNYTTGGKTTGYTWYGCDLGTAPYITGEKTHNAWSLLLEIPYSYGVLPGAVGTRTHITFPIQLETWNTSNCGNSVLQGANAFTYSQQCQKWYDSLQSQVQTAGSNSQSFGLLTPIITFFLGLILLFIGLGIGISGGGQVLGTGVQGSANENEAGSRFAQSLGLGLIVWSPLYSEFSTWFTTGLLPYGFDGTTGIIALLLTGMFFFGVFWRALSRD